MKNIKEIIVLICCCSLGFPVSMVMAAPQGGKVVGGSAHIHQSGVITTINQSSSRSVINWNSFDIGKNETVRHNMPSANSAGLHRVVGGAGASQIMGQLQSNGNVYLVNPAGVVIHKGARIDTNSFTATSRDISNDNFMKGNMVFDKPGRPDAEVINQGTISVKENGLAALVAPTVRNDGVIAGKLAKVALASGDSTWKLDMHGDDLITFTVDEKDVDTLHAVDGTPLAGVENSGSIKAEGGVVVLTAAQLDGIVGSVVNSGEVSAASAELKGGKIVFKGAGSGIDILNTGTVDVSSVVADGGSVHMDTDGKTHNSGVIAATGGRQGGKVVVTGKDVVLTGKAKIDVSGNKGGGTALVGGNALGNGPERNARTTKMEKGATIVADARTKGDGGQVVVWSDEKTNFDGTITARGGSDGGNGGKVETSGKNLKVGDTAQVDTRASKGIHGQWLLDPMDFVIAESGGDISGATLSNSLASNNVEIRSEQGHTAGNGDIIVNDDISWAVDTILTLNAERNVTVNADITATGNHAGMVINPETGSFNICNAKITLSGMDPTLFISGVKYTIIKSVQELQNINKNLSGYYALGIDIDAHETRVWNDGKGFTPIGDNAYIYDPYSELYFSGTLNGLGHNIDSLYINRADECNVGLFSQYYGSIDGYINSRIPSIKNLLLRNAYVRGDWNVGSIFGQAGVRVDENHICPVIIDNVHVSNSKIYGNGYVGGISGALSDCIIKNTSFSGDIYCSKLSGGLVGGLFSNSEIIESSTNTKIVSGNYNDDVYSVGGLVGVMNNGLVVNSFSISDIIVNINDRTKNLNIGGFVGLIEGGKIKNSYWSGAIESDSKFGVGSFVGTIDNVSSDGNVISNVDIDSCYYFDDSNNGEVQYGDIHGIGVMDAPVGSYYIYLGRLDSFQIKSQASFQGWDFENIWAIDEGQSFPYLRPVAVTGPVPSPDPTPGIDPTPTPDTVPVPTPDFEPAPAPMPNPKPNYSNPDSYINFESGIEPASGKQSGIVLTQDEEYRRKLQASYDSFENSFRKEFGEKFYNVVDDKNNKHENALEKFKSEVMFSSMYYDKKGNIIHAPDAVYEFIAKTVVDILGESKIKKYANDYEGFIKQLNKYLTDINFYKEITIDGVTYSIDNAGFALSGAGLSDCVISWKMNGKKYSVRMDWVSSPEDSMKALTEYCLALVEINKTAWEDAASYFLTGKPGASKYFSIGGDVIAALGGKPAANALVKKIGGAFAEEYTTGWFGNKFKTFVKEQIPGGADFIAAAEAINDIRVAYGNVIQAIEAGKNYSRYENDFLAACDVLDSIDGFSSESLRTFRRDFEIDKVERN